MESITSTLTPLLKTLTPKQKKKLPKMGDGNEPFVEKVLDYSESDPQFAPPYQQTDELRIDFTAVKTLTRILRPLEQIVKALDDSITLAGSEAYIVALSYYNSVKQAAKSNIPGAQPIYEDIRSRFDGQGSKKG